MVYVFLAKGFEEIEALAPVDILKRAGVEVYTVAVPAADDTEEDIKMKKVTGRSGISVIADMYFEEADFDKCEMIVLPGGMPGTTNLMANEVLTANVKKFAATEGTDAEKYVGAICAAPMILGENGLLEGKRATIYPGMEEHLVGAFPMKNRVVVDGNLITSRGAGTAMDFAAELAAILAGKEKAEEVMQSVVMGR